MKLEGTTLTSVLRGCRSPNQQRTYLSISLANLLETRKRQSEIGVNFLPVLVEVFRAHPVFLLEEPLDPDVREAVASHFEAEGNN